MKKKNKVIFLILLVAILILSGFVGGCDFIRYYEKQSDNAILSEEVKQLQEEYIDKLYTVTSSIKFREKERKLFEYAMSDAVNELNECRSESDLQSVYEKHLTLIGKIKTDDEYTTEEEANAISAYRTAVLMQAEESFDRQKYCASQITYLDSLYQTFSGNLFDSNDTEEMSRLLQDFYFDIHKEDEILKLINLTDLTDYSDSQQSVLNRSLNECVDNIRECTAEESIEEFKQVYEFEVYRQDTITKINIFINLELYRDVQSSSIKEIISEQLAFAEKASTKTELDNIFREYQIAVYDIPTEAMLYSEELEELKSELNSSLVDSYKLSLYRETEGVVVQDLLKSFESSIAAMKEKESVLSQYLIIKNRLEAVKTASDLYEEERLALIEDLYEKMQDAIYRNIPKESQFDYLSKAELVYAAMLDRVSIEGIRQEYRKLATEIGVIDAFKEELEYFNSTVYYREKEQNEVDLIKEKYLAEFNEDTSIDEAKRILQEAENEILLIKTNDDLWEESLAEFRADLRSLYGDEILEEPKSLTEASDYTELANIIDYYAFYQISGTEFVCDTFRVKLNYPHNDAVWERNEVYWYCELLKSAVDIQAKFDYDKRYIIFSLTAYNFATESNRATTEEKIKTQNTTGFHSDKSKFSKREDDFEAFPFNNYEKNVKISNSQQLWYALEHRYKPICAKGSAAESILNEAKNILRSIIMEGMSDEEKIFQIYSWVGGNVQFDNQQTSHNTSSDPENYPNEKISLLRSHFIEGGIFDRLTVCIGFSKTYLMLLCMEGIEAKINISRMPYMAGKNTINSMAWSFHAFVYVKINNKWYYSDAEKSDDRAQGTYSLRYIMLPKETGALFDERMNKDLVGGDDLNFYNNFEISGVKTYVFNKQELTLVLDTLRDKDIKTPVSIFIGYSGCVSDITDYSVNNNINFNFLNNDGFEVIVQIYSQM